MLASQGQPNDWQAFAQRVLQEQGGTTDYRSGAAFHVMAATHARGRPHPHRRSTADGDEPEELGRSMTTFGREARRDSRGRSCGVSLRLPAGG